MLNINFIRDHIYQTEKKNQINRKLKKKTQFKIAENI